MHLYESLQNFLLDKDYYIDLWQKNIHMYGFVEILVLQEEKVSLRFKNFDLEIIGHEFRVLKLTKNEILIQGNIEEMRLT